MEIQILTFYSLLKRHYVIINLKSQDVIKFYRLCEYSYDSFKE